MPVKNMTSIKRTERREKISDTCFDGKGNEENSPKLYLHQHDSFFIHIFLFYVIDVHKSIPKSPTHRIGDSRRDIDSLNLI